MRMLKYIILSLVLLGIIFINIKNIKRFYIKCDLERDLLNLFRDIDYDTKYFTDSVDRLIFWTTETKHKYDVTDSIEDYIYKIDRCYRIKKFNEDSEESYKYQNAYYKQFNYERKKNDYKKYYYLFSIDLNSALYYRFIIDNITKEQIDNYDQVKLRNELINDLKTKFKYEDGRWTIESDEKIKIDLPYNVTVGLTPPGKITHNNVKEYLKVKIKCHLNNILSEGKEDNIKLPFELTYIDTDNKKNVKELKIIVGRQKDSSGSKHKYNYNIGEEELAHLFSIPSAAIGYFTFGQKDYDTYLKTQQEPEPDPSTILINTDFRRIEIFKKYNKYNNHNQYASIMVEIFEDGSSKSYFRKFIVVDNQEGKHIREEYMQRELPYKNKTIDEVMELYINDKEQYSVDEELLKTGNSLVKYDSYTRP